MPGKKSGCISRYVEVSLVEDLKRKMVFLCGPRQAGKTSLAKHLCTLSGASVAQAGRGL